MPPFGIYIHPRANSCVSLSICASSIALSITVLNREMPSAATFARHFMAENSRGLLTQNTRGQGGSNRKIKGFVNARPGVAKGVAKDFPGATRDVEEDAG